MSETQTASLTDFLLTRFAEDEAVARAAMSAGAKWVTAADMAAGIAGSDAGLFILFHDPARVLAECEAKRRIVARLQMSRMLPPQISDDAAEAILRALASVYADHPDYRAEWAL